MNPLTKILPGLGAAVALVIVVVIIWLMLANAHLRAALAEAQAHDTACHLANDEFAQKTAAQNQAVEELHKESAANEVRARVALAAAQKSVAAFRKNAALLSQQKASGDDCKAASDLLDHYIAGVR